MVVGEVGKIFRLLIDIEKGVENDKMGTKDEGRKMKVERIREAKVVIVSSKV